MLSEIKKAMNAFNDFLDRYILPWPVRFLTFRIVILLTIGLLVPLILLDKNTVFVLAANSYLNTMSVAVSSIVLLYATISEIRQKQIAELQEKRAQEDHEHVTEMHDLILQTLQNQNKEMAELKNLLSILTGTEMAPTVLNELPDIKSLHPRGKKRFDEKNLEKLLEKSLTPNELASVIRKDFPSPDKDK